MGGKGIPFGKVFGIRLLINPSWLIVFLLSSWALSIGYFPANYPDWSTVACVLAGAATSLLFFVSVLIHELCHSLVAIRRGLHVKSITLFIFGGMAEISKEPSKALDEFLIAIAGPLASFALGGALTLLGLILNGFVGFVSVIGAVAFWLGTVNLYLGLCNMIPGFPLDGGRVLRSIIWWRSRNLLSATRISSIVGRIVSFALIATGIVFFVLVDPINGVWFALIGWFLHGMAKNSYQHVQLISMLSSHYAYEVMVRDIVFVHPSHRIDELVSSRSKYDAWTLFVVMNGDDLLGIMDVGSVAKVIRLGRGFSFVSQEMMPVARILAVEPNDSLSRVLDLMNENELSIIPVIQGGVVLGAMSSDRLQAFVDSFQKRKK